jgi:type I restriction enzyme S subunit
MAPIGSVLRVRKEKVDRKKFKFDQLQPITIHFDGSIERRKMASGRKYTMDMSFARPGDVVVAKIDLKNGAVGVVPDWNNVVVTGHFAVYEPDRNKILPEFFARIIQSSFFKSYLWRNKVGAEGRKEVKLDFFEAALIPIPSLSSQRALLAQWEKAKAKIAAAGIQVARIEEKIEGQFFADLGLKAPAMVDRPKCFVAQFRDFSRWSVGHNQSALAGTDITKGLFPAVNLGSILNLVQYGTSEKANTKSQGVPVLRINNIKKRMLDLSDIKHVELTERSRKALLLLDGDIIIIRTSGSRDLVGTCATFHESGPFVFASYLIRLRVDPAKAIPDFVSWFINSATGRSQVDAISRQIMQNNINSQELRTLQIPLPPLDVQRQIMDKVEAARAQIAREREAVCETTQRIKADLEAWLLGARKVG